MIRKFLCVLSMAAFVLAVVGCGSSCSDDNECASNPSSAKCATPDEPEESAPDVE